MEKYEVKQILTNYRYHLTYRDFSDLSYTLNIYAVAVLFYYVFYLTDVIFKQNEQVRKKILAENTELVYRNTITH